MSPDQRHRPELLPLRKEYGGLEMDQAPRMKELEKEDARLLQTVSELTLYGLILQKALNGNF